MGGSVWRRGLVALVAGVVTGLVPVAAQPVSAATGFGASASVTPGVQFLGDASGTTFTFTVRNSGTVGSIGAVEIARAASDRTVVDCPVGPSGWTVTRTDAACRFRSMPGTADDIALGAVSSAFQVRVIGASGMQNVRRTWSVRVSRSDAFAPLVKAQAEAPGLGLVVHSFEVTGVVVDPVGPIVTGAACPVSPRVPLAPGSGGHTVVVCGRNRTTGTLTPSVRFSSLSGSLLSSSGRFVSGAVVPSASSVVLGRWEGATASSEVGPDRSLVARVGSSTKRVSPATSFGGFTVQGTAPVALPVGVDGVEDEPVVISLSGSDVSGQDTTMSILSMPATGSVGVVTPSGCSGLSPRVCTASVTYTPGRNVTGPVTFQYVATAGAVSSVPATVTVNLASVNDAPLVDDDVFSVSENAPVGSVVGAVSAVDPDSGQSVSYAITAGNAAGAFEIDPLSGVITVVGALDFESVGSYPLTVTATDDGSPPLFGEATVTVEVTNGNDAPVFVDPGMVSVREDEGATIPIVSNDADDDQLSYTVTDDPDHGSLVLLASVSCVTVNTCSQSMSYTPASDYWGPDSFEIQVSDGSAADTMTVSIEVDPRADSPEALLLSDSSVPEDAAVGTAIGTLSTVDVDLPADSHTYEVVSPAGFGVQGDQLVVDGPLDFEMQGSYPVTVQSTDSTNQSVNQTFTITVIDVNDAPTAVVLAPSSIDENLPAGTVVGSLSVTDQDGGDTHTFALTTGPGDADNSRFSIGSGGQIVAQESFDFDTRSSYSIRVQATDLAGASFSAPITVTVRKVDQPTLAAGGSHSCAVTSAGGVKCWGADEGGQLGDGGANTLQPTPVDVVGLTSGVVAVTAGSAHSCALTSAGGVLCWGGDGFGQLGDGGANANQSTPVGVAGLTSGVVAVSAGAQHTCALTSAGGVLCWGWNGLGQLGNGGGSNQSAPVSVTGLASGVVSIASGGSHTCALLSTGGVRCWGYDLFGQLGDGGANANQSTPVDVAGLSTGVVAITMASFHSCALRSTGHVTCWGSDASGQLGDGGSNTDHPTPVDVAGLSGVIALEAGGSHSCAVLGTGGAMCWGWDGWGQLGDDPAMVDQSTPVSVAGLSSGVVVVAAGGNHSCAVVAGGGVKCWGRDSSGQLGDDANLVSQSTPVDVVGLTARV